MSRPRCEAHYNSPDGKATQELPVTLTADRTIKISGSRVSPRFRNLNYRQGATAER